MYHGLDRRNINRWELFLDEEEFLKLDRKDQKEVISVILFMLGRTGKLREIMNDRDRSVRECEGCNSQYNGFQQNKDRKKY